jgi:catechol 2,3-dioxygenase-like lactoylglutathione lyase family enzyme
MMTRVLTLAALLAAAAPLHAQAPVATMPAPAAPALIGPALHVSDVTRSVAFYNQGLGMKVAIQRNAGKVLETMLVFGDATQPAVVLLSDPAEARQPITHGYGFSRLILRLVDLPAVAARLRALGFAPSAVRDVGGGYRMMTVTDPDGYELEIVERSMEKAS